MKFSFIVFLAFFIPALTSAQIDREFWFAVPEASANHGDDPIYLRISAFDKAAKVIVDVPALSTFKPINITVKANEFETVNLTSFKGILECITPNTIKKNGLRIRSNQVVSVYYEIDNNLNRDIFSLKGRSALGKEFYTPFQNVYNNGTFVALIYSSIDVVATEDNTAITVNPTKELYGSALQTRKIILDKGETYSFRASSAQASNHLTGTEILSNKPIAVTIKDDSVDPIGTCKDMVGDQLVPTNIIGTEYVVRKGQLTFADEYFFILAVKDGTKIETNGAGSYTLNKGQSASIIMKNDEYFVEASEPVYVFHLSGFGCETGGAIIPPLKCTGANSVSFARSSNESLYINLVVPKGKESYFKFNGNTGVINASDFNNISGTSDWVSGQLEITNGTLASGNVAVISNDSARFQLGVINGGASTGAKYGYFSPFSSLNLGDNVSLCFGEKIILDAGFGFDTILWNTNATSQLLLVDTPGTYTVRTATRNGCVLNDTVVVNISPKPIINTNDSIQCLINNEFNFGTTSSSTSAYSWRIEGKIFPGDTAIYSFGSVGIKTVWLRSTTDQGCIDSSAINVELLKHPSAQIDFSQKMACLNEELTIKNSFIVNSTGMVYNWNLGDGNLSTDKLVNHKYTSIGQKNVQLVVIDSNGCTDTATNKIIAIEGIKAEYTINDTAQCLNENEFEFEVQNTASSYYWSLGNGALSGSQKLTYPYARDGKYNVMLAIIDTNNCRDTSIKTVYVYESPKAKITVNDSAQCPYENDFIFKSGSTISLGSLKNNWDFGDMNTASGDSVGHSYIQFPIIETVTLVSSSDLGCTDTALQQVVIDPAPVARFEVNDSNQCLSNNLFNFSNTSTISSGLLQANWQFGDGDSSNLTSPAHIYNSSDTFLVRLVSYAQCFDTATLEIVVHPQPDVSFTINDSVQCFNNHEIEAASTSTIKYGTFNNEWFLGDNSKNTDSSFNYVYGTRGTYLFKLLNTSNEGCKDSQKTYITINPSPVAAFGLNDANQCFNEQEFITINKSSLDSGTLNYSWLFGNGQSSVSLFDSITYQNEGSYIIQLVSSSSLGCTDTVAKTAIALASPNAAFTISDSLQCITNNNFNFTNTSTITAGNLVMQWSFGDLENSTELNPSHTYTNADTFKVLMVATSDSFCTDTASKRIVVWDKPNIRFVLNDTDQCLINNQFLSFNNSLTYQDSLFFEWKFGDGGSSTLKEPGHSYSAPGRFEFKLIGRTNTGCTDSFSRMIDVYDQPAPNAGFNLESDSAQCLKGNEFTLQNLSDISSGKLSLIWKPDDGRVIEDSILKLSYAYADTFSFRLIAVSEFGCKDSIERNLYVWPQVELNLSYSYPLCINDSFTVSDSSKVEWGNWQSEIVFDAKKSTTKDTILRIDSAANYSIVLLTETNYGCLDTLTDTFWVNDKISPVVSFKYFYNQTVELIDNSTSNIGPYTSWTQWPDGSIDSTKKFIQRIDTGNLNKGISLFIQSDSGCVSSTIDTPIFKNNYPTIAFATRAVDTSLYPVEIHWEKDPRATLYDVYLTNERPYTNLGSTKDTFFSDLANLIGPRDFNSYRIVGIDSLTNRSDFSDSVKNIAITNIQLIANTKHQVEWTPYGFNWNDSFEYIIYQFERANLKELARVKNSVLTYTDSSASAYNTACYRIAATNKSGYTSWSSVLCNELIYWVPNAFSPNGDGTNDEFTYWTNGLYDIEMTVFAPNGQRVFYSQNRNHFWDGKIKGETVELGTYLWILKGNEIVNGENKPFVRTGNLQVIR